MRLRHRKTGQSARRGFSLTELMAVVAVMGLIASVVAIDFMASLPRARLNSTLHDLAASYVVSSPYTLGGGMAQTDDERVLVKRILLPEGISIERVTIDGIDYTDGRVFVSFSPIGTATGHTLMLVQAPMESITTVEVLPLTGQTRFHDGNFVRDPVTEEDFD